jgi:hypothetical protein
LLGKNERGKYISKLKFRNSFLEIGVHYKSENDYENAKSENNGDVFNNQPYCSVKTSTCHRTRYYRNLKADELLKRFKIPALTTNQQELDLEE